jgi:hypothetical protein
MSLVRRVEYDRAPQPSEVPEINGQHEYNVRRTRIAPHFHDEIIKALLLPTVLRALLTKDVLLSRCLYKSRPQLSHTPA